MVATQPKFNVTFKEDAVLAIQRQERGNVVLILKDTTKTDLDKVVYRGLGDVNKADFTAQNYQRITLAFLGNPSKVIVVKAETEFAKIQEKLAYFNNYTLCYPEATGAEQTSIINYIKAQRKVNNYSRAILANATAPDEQSIINFCTANADDKIKAIVNGEEVELTAGDYTARIGGALSGLATSRSLTYFELPEIVEVALHDSEDSAVALGKLIILHQDGSYKFGRAVNSLVTLTDGITEAFQKIRVLDIMDMVANDIVATFRKGYVGKYTNNFTNKNRFIGAINSYLHDLAVEGLLEIENDNVVYLSYDKIKSYLEGKGVDTKDYTYNQMLRANTGSRVLLDGVCSPTDAMEDLDLGMYLFQALQAE